MSEPSAARAATDRVIRVVALDLDGTILESGQEIHRDVLDLLRWLSGHGVRCVTATGRQLDFQLELLARYGIADCFRALIADERELFLRRNDTFTPDREWNGWIRRRWSARAQEAGQWIHRAATEAARRGLTARPATDTEIAARGLASLRFDEPEAAEAVAAWLADRMLERGSRLGCNRNVAIVQVYDAMAGKAAVLSRLATAWSLSPAEILAIGDSSNDHTMLDGAHGFRCATVANASDVIKATVQRAGGYVARSNSGAGVVEAVRALVSEAADRSLDTEAEAHAHRAYQ